MHFSGYYRAGARREKIWHNAHHDLLTGLPNRRLFLDRLEQEIKHAKRSGLPLSVFFLDLMGSTKSMIRFGHEAGGLLLVDVAKRLTGCVREVDTVARLGGDEFTVLLTGAKLRRDVEIIAQTIINSLAVPFHIAHHSVQISASIAVSFYPRYASSSVSLLQAADQAMYKAKKSGYDKIYFLNSSDEKISYLPTVSG